MNEVLTFERKTIRMVGAADRPEWIAKDVADLLGIGTGSYSVAKPANKAEWLLQQAQLMVEHENRLAQQESRVQAVEQLALAALDVQTSNYAHYTILAWCRLKGINLNVAKSGKVGKKLTKIMRVAGRAGEIGWA